MSVPRKSSLSGLLKQRQSALILSMGGSNHYRPQSQFFLGNVSQFCDATAIVLGYWLKLHIGSWETLAAVGGSVVEGLALREILVPDAIARPVHMSTPDDTEEWHLAAVAFWHLIMGMVEPNPAYDPSSALVDYLSDWPIENGRDGRSQPAFHRGRSRDDSSHDLASHDDTS